MANTFVDPHQVVGTALSLLRDDLVIARTFNRDYEADFGGGRGASVNVRIPAVLTAKTRTLTATSAITIDDLTESTQAVALDEHAYSAVKVTDADLTLSITDFGKQVLSPQSVAIAEHVENKAVLELQGLTETLTIAYDAANPLTCFLTARKALRDMGAPMSGLIAAVGTDIYMDVVAKLATSNVQVANGDATGARLTLPFGGFEVIESNRLDDGEMVFYHPYAFTLAVRAPAIPDGVAFGASQAAEGFAVRWIKDYDSSTLNDRSILSTFIGTQAMALPRVDAAGTVTTVTPAIRVLATTTPA